MTYLPDDDQIYSPNDPPVFRLGQQLAGCAGCLFFGWVIYAILTSLAS